MKTHRFPTGKAQLRFAHTAFLSMALLVFASSLLAGCAGREVRPAPSGEEYVVNGKRYRILGSSKGFVQRGTASWYGEDFHGRKTASGEIYDMEKFTAAHRTLPLGTYVRVKRLDRRGAIVVEINDRGPFVRGRIIDLSRAGARQLDMLEDGIAEVEIIALGEKHLGSRPDDTVFKPRMDYREGSFAVQVGAFVVKENAHRLAADLKREFEDSSVTLFDRGDQVFYRVRVGRFSREEEAEGFREKLLGDGWTSEAFVVAR